jgi:hypothetical protein
MAGLEKIANFGDIGAALEMGPDQLIICLNSLAL